MKVYAVIPARLASTRLPRKPLADIHGHPMLWYVWRQVKQAQYLDEVYIATDSDEICAAAKTWGSQVLMTSPECRSGTERIASVLDALDAADRILNVQGDEPLIDPKMLDNLVADWDQKGGDIITPVFRIKNLADLLNPNVVKVARTKDGRALYFSRSPIPYIRDSETEHWLDREIFWGHIGAYGYRREVLETYPMLPISPLEAAENLEQLRFLEAGFQIRVVETAYRPVAVDTYSDLEQVRQMIAVQESVNRPGVLML